MQSLLQKAQAAPDKPGVYTFLSAQGEVLYVGKAKNLRNRLLQYFGQDLRPQLPFLMEEAVDIDYVIVGSELESLFFESTLIKRFLPRYNIKLRDDKNYAFITIDYNTEIPSIGYTRKVDPAGKKIKYFGPYSSVQKIRTTLDTTRKIFPYCARTSVGKRPCFYYYLHRCPGVCIGAISVSEYHKELEKIILFFAGNTKEIKKELQGSMRLAAKNKRFENAAKLRDQLHAITVLEERQSVIFPAWVQWDFVSLYTEAPNACINLFKIREGKLIDKESFIYMNISRGQETLALQTFLEQYYAETSDTPRAVFLSEPTEHAALITQLVKERNKKTITIEVPKRGKKQSIAKLGITNAKEYLHKWQASSAQSHAQLQKALESLQTILMLPKLPRRIEGYDISNTQGTNPVSSMVVTKDGLPAKSEYRKFKIKSKSTPDDFAMMQETIFRRIQHLATHAKAGVPVWQTPDLLVIDGGKGQLSSVMAVLKKYNVTIPVIGLAKRIEEIFLPNNKNPILLTQDDPALHILQRLRDEAHRFGITFHRTLRSKQAIQSQLDTIPGIGPKTKKALKQKFGSLQNIKTANRIDVENLIGQYKSDLLFKALS